MMTSLSTLTMLLAAAILFRAPFSLHKCLLDYSSHRMLSNYCILDVLPALLPASHSESKYN